ncbi:MAG TPA: ATP-binding cassette domain-containing protein [candidate division Zixibacteria bacterium]|nr:ATP-binding cassette domain-containing protein [candidate division Zixibacteria bacterium]
MYSVEVRNLAKRFGDIQAVADVSFGVEPGEIFGLLGPNGAGKTTTIRMMMDIFKPDFGEVTIFGGKLDLSKKRRIGYLPEERGLYKDQKLESTLVYLATLKGMDEKSAKKELDAWLERFDLVEYRHKKTQELSKGMQQKAQIIVTLLHDPDLIIIDEPFSGLDPVNTRLVKSILDEQREKGKAIIMSTHQMYQVEALCNRIVLINRGRTVLYGQVNKIKRNFAGNAIIIQGQGNFEQLPGVLETRRQDSTWHLALELGTDPQEIFRILAAREGVKIERFELAEPSLDDIFISVVSGADGPKTRNETEATHA